MPQLTPTMSKPCMQPPKLHSAANDRQIGFALSKRLEGFCRCFSVHLNSRGSQRGESNPPKKTPVGQPTLSRSTWTVLQIPIPAH